MTKPQEVGTRFPFINLEKAIGRAKELYQADPRGRPLAVPTAFAAWSYSEKSSGGHQTVAALKMYGLVSDSGAYADRRVALTEDALRFFADEREDERKKAIKQFALNPKLIAAVWNDWGPTPPQDNVARSHLKLDRKLNEQSARSFLSIYKDNIRFAELDNSAMTPSESGGDGDVAEEHDADAEGEMPSIGDLIQWSPDGIDQFRTPARVRAIASSGEWLFVEGSETGIPMAQTSIVQKGPGEILPPISHAVKPPTMPLPEANPGLKRDVFSLDEGEVTITFPASLTRASFNDLVDWLDLVKRKAERAVKPDQDNPSQ